MSLHYSLSPLPSSVCGKLLGGLHGVKSKDLLRNRLDALLAERNMSPAEFARAMNRSEPWVSSLRAGKRGVTLKTLDTVAEFFEVPVGYLLTETGAKTDKGLPRHTSTVQLGFPAHKGGPHASATVGLQLERKFAKGVVATLQAEIVTLCKEAQRTIARGQVEDAPLQAASGGANDRRRRG